MKLVLEDFTHKGEHFDRYEIELKGIDVDDIIAMSSIEQMSLYNKIKDKVTKRFLEED